MANSSQPEATVRARCACGQRYRVKHARADVALRCPKCGRPIVLRPEDLRGGAGAIPLVPLQGSADAAPEARLLEAMPLRLAPQGSRTGVVGPALSQDEDALLDVRWDMTSHASRLAPAGSGPIKATTAAFLRDLFSSFVFAGRLRNAGVVMASVAGITGVLVIVELIAKIVSIFALPLLFIASAFISLYVAQFFWRMLTQAAAGDNEIPAVDPDWDFIDDALKPAIAFVAITALCFVPGALLYQYPPVPVHGLAVAVAAWAAGAVVWPIALLSYAIGESVIFLRPDWLVRCIFAIGPAYFIAWVLTLGVPVGYWFLSAGIERLDDIPVVGFVLYVGGSTAFLLYCGYVEFRMIGLLYRYYGSRFPWRL